ncbi:MAG: hypothetical protein WBN14_09215 [Polyangiales bacterium]
MRFSTPAIQVARANGVERTPGDESHVHLVRAQGLILSETIDPEVAVARPILNQAIVAIMPTPMFRVW